VTPHVEILYVAGCPHNERARALVEHVAAELQIAPTIELVEVPDAESAKELRFFGSPTIRVNGRDVEPHADRPYDFVLACRIYRGWRGTTGWPTSLWVREALAEAVR
jgi:hypothetical protein